MSKSPLVSVCVITYGHENFIEQSINSILMQKCDFDFEIILSNDCSPDSTDKVVQQILKTHPKAGLIKYFNHNKNIGAMSNFLFALKECSGKFLALCEGDDYWLDEYKLQKQLNFLKINTDYSLCFTSRKVIDENEKNISQETYGFKDWSTIDILNGLIPPTQTILSKNLTDGFISFYQKHKGSFGADKLYGYFYSLQGKLKSLPDYTAVYRNNGLGIWTKYNEYQKLVLHVDESIKFYNIISKNNIEFNSLKVMLFRRMFNNLSFQFVKNPKNTVILYFKIILKYKPPLISICKSNFDFFNYYYSVFKNKIM